jgi:hypothetical protein
LFPKEACVSIANRDVFAKLDSSLPGRCLGVRVVWIGFVRFMVADHATCRRAYLSVPGHVTGHPADDGSFDTSLRVGADD